MNWITDLGNAFSASPGIDQNGDVLRLLVILATILGGVGLYLVSRLLMSLVQLKPARKPKKVKPRAPISIKLTLEDFTQIRRKMKFVLSQELEEAEGSERERISARLAELSTQNARPAEALADMQRSIEALEKLLESFGQDVAPEAMIMARAAMERVDLSVAEKIFSDVELKADQSPDASANASYGRGKIAELEFRWHDAAEHYARAARLQPNYDTLSKASTFLWLNGRAQEAIWFEEDLVAFVRRNFGSGDPRTAVALNSHAGSLYAARDFTRAEEIMIEVLRLDRETIGTEHPDYAAHLNTLALVLEAQGRRREAEEYYRQALDIDRITIGEMHQDFAVRLSDLATVVEAQGRFDEAEEMFRQVLEVDRGTIGDAHPEYAVHLNNLAGVIEVQRRYSEAENLYMTALEIIEKALGAEHPNTLAVRRNLESLLQKKPSISQKRPALAVY